MTALEALAILEAATLECKKREADTAELRAGLDFLELHIQPVWLIPQFRHHIGGERKTGYQRESQQQVLRPTFEGIRDSVRELVEKTMDALALQLTVAYDTKIKVEVDRLKEANLSVNAIAERKPEILVNDKIDVRPPGGPRPQLKNETTRAPASNAN